MAVLMQQGFDIVAIEPEGIWIYEVLPAVVQVDKTNINANSTDMATIIAEVNPTLSEITFYHADTDEPIATVPVDPETHTATLKVVATTPGVIRIRAGEPTVTKFNEVVITAQ